MRWIELYLAVSRRLNSHSTHSVVGFSSHVLSISDILELSGASLLGLLFCDSLLSISQPTPTKYRLKRPIEHIKWVKFPLYHIKPRHMTSKVSLETLLQIAVTLSVDGQKFMEFADKIRRAVAPLKSYPGVIANLPVPQLHTLTSILTKFSDTITRHPSRFEAGHISRGIDALFSASAAFACLSLTSNSSNNLAKCFACIEDSVRMARNLNPHALQYCSSSAFNLVTYLFKEKQYETCIQLFPLILTTAEDLGQIGLMKKTYQLQALSLLALGRHELPEFIEAVSRADDRSTLLYSWVGLHPPSDPRRVTALLDPTVDVTRLIPYFTLHGCFEIIPECSPFREFYPQMETPEEVELLHDRQLLVLFHRSRQLYHTELYRECAMESVMLLKQFPRKKLKPHGYIALLQLYKWMIESFGACGKPDAAIYYAIQMRNVFRNFAFTVGYAALLELKSRAQLYQMDEFQPPPALEFKSSVTWNSVAPLWNALRSIMINNENCFRYFQYVLDFGNIIVKRCAIPYYAIACRMFQVHAGVESFERICKTSKESHAEFLYSVVVGRIRHEDLEGSWSYTHPIPPDPSLLSILSTAEDIGKSYVTLKRKIQQLKALLLGTSTPVQTANLITCSVSRTLDQYLDTATQGKFVIPFPLLSVAYFDVSGLPPCLLFSLYLQSSRPLVARIETGDTMEEILAELEAIQNESTSISADLPKKDWWNGKRLLDERMKSLLDKLENLLGIWKGVFAPHVFEPTQNAMMSALFMSLHSAIILKPEIESILGTSITKFPRLCNSLPLGIILGKQIHRIPWESLPIVIESRTVITRIPSIRLVAIQAQKQIPVNIDARSGFYILNPNGDLNETEMTFRSIFENLQWDGLVQIAPDSDMMESAIQQHDLFVYCGHGSGTEFFDYQTLLERGKPCRAMMLLMGCSSGELLDDGDMDPFGVPYYCLGAGSGCVVANLWNVTDRDIDRFLMELLRTSVLNGPCEIAEAVTVARQSCKLRYLTGAAPVVYGFLTVVHGRREELM
jgi:separase